ncbi:MAG TPA: zf-HC2 domain-containing protein [Tepidisphaeraceae bacterium]|jgi:anti-sigma factor RsiW
MSCPSDETLVMFVDGELDAPERETVARHVQTCSACGESVAEMRAVNRRGRSALREMRVDVQRDGTKARRRWVLRPMAVAAAIVIVVSVAAVVWMKGHGASERKVAQLIPPHERTTRPATNPLATARAAPRLMDAEFERWSAGYRRKRIALVPMEEVAVFEPPEVRPTGP